MEIKLENPLKITNIYHTISVYKTNNIELYFDHYFAKYVGVNYIELYGIKFKENYNNIILYLPSKVIYESSNGKTIYNVRFDKKLYHINRLGYFLKDIKQIIIFNKILTQIENYKWKLN